MIDWTEGLFVVDRILGGNVQCSASDGWASCVRNKPAKYIVPLDYHIVIFIRVKAGLGPGA
jgi:hypothetical protein